jgi:hypothetical protein
MDDEMALLLSQAENALAVIRGFNKTVPLNRILRCAERDMSILPKPVSGGEDWFSLYKEYWKYTVEERFNDYIRRKRRQELREDLQVFFNGAELQPFTGAGTAPGILRKGDFCLSFLWTFHSVLFLPELNPVLFPILTEGKFFKAENRAEFTGAYNELFTIDERIRHFEGEISSGGELGKRYAAAQMDRSSLLMKRHTARLVEEDAADEAAKIARRIRDAMGLMTKVLGGILAKSPDGKYDTLTNRADMAGKTTAFTSGVSTAIIKLTGALELMDKIAALEAGW